MGNVEIPKWLEGLPLAPEFRPTDTEFADPIAYISKIEKEASAFGICKVIPPLPKPSKKYVFGNLNKSLLKSPELGSSYLSSSSKAGSSDGGSDGEVRAVFTTRQQELGQTVKKLKGAVQNPSSGAHKQVWQSGEIYTLEQFESKSRVFAKSQLGMIKDVSPLVIEAMFWKAASEKPIYLEYANDVPGSGFGEPDGQFRYFHRRRRKRNFFTRTGESSSCKTSDMDSDRIDVSPTDDVQLASPRNESCIGVSVSPSSPPALPAAKEASQSLKKRSQRSCHDKEGTAGWKISNSPWNLQVISRSPGSLTRFMPDDIPGVTSPMVYIGMLFSWFAWHVEDHELHSMNFLHTGASKTWYSVPGDYAFAFEEVVRTEAYGANIDRIAALALLGEKTTLMSPKVAVASGIPCCRLVQNPGEYVVTFPRAYHIGFSHGFNCGEAANFGTPQWLNVAKEAAVRRAAMSYLPMLSHQQLLYLLTMSFVSRVPRCFLPGVRSSRLRDRQKEEREFLVKKAFVEDILHENKTLSVLLGKDSGYHAVLWNQDLLAHPGKETVSPSAGATVDAISTEKSSHVDTRKHSNKHPSLLDEMSLYMENLNDLYLGSDDLSCDFQVDSGTLACVACGILGFPFMSVVQPTEKAALDLDQEYPGTSGCPKPCSTQTLDASNDFSFPENPSSLSNSSVVNRPLPSINKSRNGWNVHNKFLRPRSFCLEHAVEIVELLQSKGGANVLVICHSDYKKIKAHATTIAEEIGCSFSYSEVPLDIASKEDLNLIDLAVEGVEHKETGEDWTSKLGINLRHCVKIRKNSASKQVQHALTLGGLLSNKCSSSDFSAMKWKMRRSRSKKIYLPDDIKPRNTAESKIDVLVEKNSLAVKKEAKIIQYTRRKLKTKQGDSSGAGKICGNPTTLVDHEQSKFASENKIRNAGNSTGIDFSPTTVQGMPTEMPKPKETRYESSKVSVGSVEIHSLEEINGDSEVHHLVASVESDQMQTEPNVAAQKVGSADEPGKEHSACLSQHLTERSIEIYEEKNVVEQSNRTNEACNLASEGRSKVLGDENVLASSPAYPGDEAMESSCMDNQVCALVPVVDNVVCGVPDTRTNDVKPDSCTTAGKDHYLGSMQEFFEGPREICSAVESSNENPLETEPEQNKSRVNEQNETVPVLTKVTSENLSDLRAGLTLDEELHKNVGVHAGKIEELASCSATQMEVDNPCVSMLEHPVVERGSSPQGHLTNDVILGDCSKVEASMEKGEQGSVPFHVSQAGNQPIAIEREELAEDHPQDGLTLDDNIERKRQDKEKETVSVTATAFQKYSRVRRDVRSAEDSCNGSEVCSPQDRESENVGTNAVEGGSNTGKGRKRNRELERLAENKLICSNFIRSPCEGLRPRAGKDATESSSGADVQREVKQKPETKIKKPPTARPPPKEHNKEEPGKLHKCDIEGCRMSFVTKAELSLHKRNLCPHKGCGKKFSSHKYAMVHHRVHDDERPLKCPWKGCSMSFKWAWARTEHIRVHTGEKPYKCKIEGCGLSFRFVSDFSRHRRKTGHFVS